MMKNIYYILLMSVLIFGCQKQTSPQMSNTSGSYIFFETEIAGTKANLIEDNLPNISYTSFNVFGYRSDNVTPIFNMYKEGANSSFDNVAVLYRNDIKSDFSCDEMALWHNGEHTFYGYYYGASHNPRNPNYSKDIITGINKLPARPFIEYKQPETLDGMIDLMTATKTANASGGPVILTFDHRLFALDIIVKNSQSATPLKIIAASVEFYNILSSATIYFDGGMTGNTYGNLEHTYNIAEGTEIKNTDPLNLNDIHDKGSDSFLLLPCPSLKATIILTIVDSWNEVQELTIDRSANGEDITPEGGFLAGHKYELTINKTDKGIEFGYNIVPWDDEVSVGMEFN